MKTLLYFLSILFLTFNLNAFTQSVGINSTGAAPTSGAMLEVIQAGTSEAAYFHNSNTSYNGGNGVHIRTYTNSDDKYALKVTSQNGEIEGLTVTGAGKVGIGIASPETELDVNGVIHSNFEGFSYNVENLFVSAELSWQNLVISTLDYNTFANEPYNTTNGTFTAPYSGYYRFSLYGYAQNPCQSAGDRYAFGVAINGTLKSLSGGNYSNSDSPLNTYSAVMYLSSNDVVTPRMFSSIDATLGNGSGHQFWFQGEFLGR